MNVKNIMSALTSAENESKLIFKKTLVKNGIPEKLAQRASNVYFSKKTNTINEMPLSYRLKKIKEKTQSNKQLIKAKTTLKKIKKKTQSNKQLIKATSNKNT